MIKEQIRPTKSQKLGWKDFVDDRLILTLQRMQKFNSYAIQNEIKSDQLAVPISDLRRWGHSDTELRLLVIEGVFLHLKENREEDSDQRKFERGGIYSIGEASCFVLSEIHTKSS